MRRTTPSEREKQITDLLDAGKSPQEAAEVLGIGLATVNTHRYKAARRREGPRPLSKRQREVVSCLALGLTIEEVADHLGIGRGTAVNHRTLAGLSIGARSAVVLAHYAIVQGWIEPGEALSPERIDAALQRIARDAASS
jgi:DNA-binding CsgD family transcriptional regulator